MNRFIRPLLFLFVPLLTAYGQDANGTSTVTFGLGAGRPYNYADSVSGGPQLNGNYEYRLRKHWALEFGANTTLVTAPSTLSTSVIYAGTTPGTYNPVSYTYSYAAKHAFATAMPFGFRDVLPLSQGRLELFAGGGGAYLWNPSTFGYGRSGPGGWGLQANLGVRIAIDKQRRFWLGTTGRLIDDTGASPAQWFTWTADLGFRFGH